MMAGELRKGMRVIGAMLSGFLVQLAFWYCVVKALEYLVDAWLN